MTKMRTRIGSIVLAVAMLLTLLPVTAFAEEPGTVSVSTFQELQAAQTEEEGSIIEVSGDINMTSPVTFTNKVTLKLTKTANLTYTSDNNSQIYLITLKGGSTLDMAAGAKVTMTGDSTNQTVYRDWRALYSDGNLTVTQFAGEITITNARGRALYAYDNLTFNCPVAGQITMDNPNGENTVMYGIVSYRGSITLNQGVSEDAKIKIYFGKGNTASGIIAQTGGPVIINGDMAGTIDVQMGISHAAYGIYAAQNGITITGDISGSIYARGASGSGYGIVAVNGDISIAKISGSVIGDCYNKIMNNSQSGASAIYANNGSIYGSDEDTPLQLTGTLSSTVGRNDAFTVQAKGDVSIHMGEGAVIKAQSSYGAEWTNLEPSYEEMSNNWGGAAAGVVAGGEIDITGSDDGISATSASEGGKEIEAGFLADTGALENVTNISNFLYYVARGDEANAIKANEKLTEEDKELINGYEDIAEDLFTVKVGSLQALIDTLNSAKDGTIIALTADITLDARGLPGAAISGKNLTINGNGHTLSFAYDRANNMLHSVFGNETNPLYADTNLTVKNLSIVNTGAQGGYAAMVGYNANGAQITYKDCTFKNLAAAAYVNPITEKPEDGGVTLEITGCKYENTLYGYAVDKTSGYQLTEVIFENNTGSFAQSEPLKNVVYATVSGYEKAFSSIQAAIDAADNNSTVTVAPGTYTGNIHFAEKSLTIKGANAGIDPNTGDRGEETIFTGTMSTSVEPMEDTTPQAQKPYDSTFNPNQKVVIDGITFSGDGLKIGDNNYNSVGSLTVTNCIFEPGKDLGKDSQHTTDGTNYHDWAQNMYNYFVKICNDPDKGYFAKVTLTNNQINGNSASTTATYPVALWCVDDVTVENNVFDFTSPALALNISKVDTDASIAVNNNIFNNVTSAVYFSTWAVPEDAYTGNVEITGNKITNATSEEVLFVGYDDEIHKDFAGTVIDLDNTLDGQPVSVVIGQKENSNIQIVTATFKNGGAVIGSISGALTNGKLVITTLPAPTRDNCTFDGWSDGKTTYKAEAEVTITADTTFTAQWSYIDQGGSSGGSTVSGNLVIVDSGKNGQVTVSPQRAEKGETVTITVKPDAGYELKNLTVTDKDGDSVKLTDKGNGKYTFKMPDTRVTVEATFQAVKEQSPVDAFVDVNTGAWYYDAVKYAVENGLMAGVTANTFQPNATLSRAMIAQMLYALEGKPSVSAAGGFADVPANAWFAKAAYWAQSKSIITGYDAVTFGPNDSLTREQLALILYNYAKTKGYDTSDKANLNVYLDGSSTSVWAQEGMSWAVGAGLISGKGLNMLYPTGTATRAEVAQIMMNFCENVAK